MSLSRSATSHSACSGGWLSRLAPYSICGAATSSAAAAEAAISMEKPAMRLRPANFAVKRVVMAFLPGLPERSGSDLVPPGIGLRLAGHCVGHHEIVEFGSSPRCEIAGFPAARYVVGLSRIKGRGAQCPTPATEAPMKV